LHVAMHLNKLIAGTAIEVREKEDKTSNNTTTPGD